MKLQSTTKNLCVMNYINRKDGGKYISKDNVKDLKNRIYYFPSEEEATKFAKNIKDATIEERFGSWRVFSTNLIKTS